MIMGLFVVFLVPVPVGAMVLRRMLMAMALIAGVMAMLVRMFMIMGVIVLVSMGMFVGFLSVFMLMFVFMMMLVRVLMLVGVFAFHGVLLSCGGCTDHCKTASVSDRLLGSPGSFLLHQNIITCARSRIQR